jgi:hypothetical protein
MKCGKPVIFEVIPHPHHRSDWFLKPPRGAPCGLWYRERPHAVSYAEWVAREVDSAEILIRNSDGSVERRLVERPS